MTGRLLVVCSQNVCRSPYIALALAQRRDLVDGVEGAAGGLIVASRGTSATPGEAMCEVAAQHFTTEQVEGHQSRALTASDLQRADLVLTMSVAERAAAALLYPPSRPRTLCPDRSQIGSRSRYSGMSSTSSRPSSSPW